MSIMSPSSFLSLSHITTKDRYSIYLEYCQEDDRESVSFEEFKQLYGYE